MSKMFSYPLVMAAGGGNIPVQDLGGQFRFISIVNATDNTITVYKRRVTVAIPSDQIGVVLPYTAQTFPLDDGLQDLTFIYVDGGAASPKVANVFFSQENLGYSGALGTTITGNVGIITDSVGLARQNQLPGALGASGGLKVEVVAEDVNPLPVSFTSLPAGSNLIGSVKSLKGTISAFNVTAATAVKGSAGRLYRVSVIVAGSAAGSVNDAATTGAAAAGNQIGTIPNTVGVYTFDWPCANGIVVTPGTGQTLAVSYD